MDKLTIEDVMGVFYDGWGNRPDRRPRIRAAIEQFAAEQVVEAKSEKDAAYLERNQLVALLSTLYPSGKGRTAIEGWSEDWHGCVYIDFPWGQASWHFHDSHAHLFNHLPPYKGAWDGHTTEQKYAAIDAAIRSL